MSGRILWSAHSYDGGGVEGASGEALWLESWSGPYLPKEVPVDPWGEPYIFKSPGEHEEYDLFSYGLDGTEGGEGENQDVVNWKDMGR